MMKKTVFGIGFFFMSMLLAFGQVPVLPGDPLAGGGVGVPLDGGVLLGILAGASIFVAFVKNKKNKKE